MAWFLWGEIVESMADTIRPILNINTNFIFLHSRTDNAINRRSQDILNKLIQLRFFIMNSNKNYKTVIS